MSASLALSLVYEAQGRHAQASELADALATHMFESGNTSHLDFAQAQQAEIARRQGRLAEAVRWADGFKTQNVVSGYYFNLPDFAAAKIRVYQGDATQRERVDGLLHELQERFESTHNVRFVIATLALRALFESKRDKADLADELLTRAVEMAQPGGFIRLFVDMGPAISRLLNRVKGDEETLQYVGEIQAAFRAELRETQPAAAASASFRSGSDSLETLSRRELEVLGLLSRSLTNREIGSELYISPETVKRHTKNIYQKLSVGSRIDAVAKAKGLGILRNI